LTTSVTSTRNPGARGLGARLDHPAPVSWCGLSTGFDSGEPRWRRKIESRTTSAIDRNSLCQFWNDSNQKRDVPA
jgi:hypothetical protein